MMEEYLSPIRKLVPFFKNSRDQWKEKSKLAKQENKRLKNNLQYMKKVNNELKNKIALLENELKKNDNYSAGNNSSAKVSTKS